MRNFTENLNHTRETNELICMVRICTLTQLVENILTATFLMVLISLDTSTHHQLSVQTKRNPMS